MGQPALSLAAQLQRRAARMDAPPGLADDLAADLTDGDGDLGRRLFGLVREAAEHGVDPEAELRAVSRVFRDRVRAWERARQRA
jgi:XTP/dITP diphosphohydrolase